MSSERYEYLPTYPPAVPYVTVTRVKSVIFSGKPVGTEYDAVLTGITQTVSGLIDRKCGTAFGVLRETRVFNVPSGVFLATPDLLEIRIGQDGGVTVWGTAINADDLRQVPPYSNYQTIDGLEYWPSGVPTFWSTVPVVVGETPITVDAHWQAYLPPEIILVAEILTCRLWQMRLGMYTGDTGNAAFGSRGSAPSPLWTPEVLEMLAPYIETRVRQIIGPE
jgi:hypothetical protein